MPRYCIHIAFFLTAVAGLVPLDRGAFGQQPVASFYYDNRGNVTRQERDTNGDGKMDRWTYYNRQGQIERVEQDVNFDGKPDVFVYYEGGVAKRQEIASKNDGQIDTWIYLTASGEIERRGEDT